MLKIKLSKLKYNELILLLMGVLAFIIMVTITIFIMFFSYSYTNNYTKLTPPRIPIFVANTPLSISPTAIPSPTATMVPPIPSADNPFQNKLRSLGASGHQLMATFSSEGENNFTAFIFDVNDSKLLLSKTIKVVSGTLVIGGIGKANNFYLDQTNGDIYYHTNHSTLKFSANDDGPDPCFMADGLDIPQCEQKLYKTNILNAKQELIYTASSTYKWIIDPDSRNLLIYFASYGSNDESLDDTLRLSLINLDTRKQNDIINIPASGTTDLIISKGIIYNLIIQNNKDYLLSYDIKNKVVDLHQLLNKDSLANKCNYEVAFDIINENDPILVYDGPNTPQGCIYHLLNDKIDSLTLFRGDMIDGLVTPNGNFYTSDYDGHVLRCDLKTLICTSEKAVGFALSLSPGRRYILLDKGIVPTNAREARNGQTNLVLFDQKTGIEVNYADLIKAAFPKSQLHIQSDWRDYPYQWFVIQ